MSDETSPGPVSKGDPEKLFAQFPSEEQTLKAICEKHSYIDRDLMLDVYFILKDEGTLNFQRTDDLMKDFEREDPDYWTSRIKIEDRKDYLKNMAQTTYFQGLLALKDTTKALWVFADTMGKLYADSLRAKFGKENIGHNSGETPHREFTEQDLDIIQAYKDNVGGSFLEFMSNEPKPEEIAENEAMQEWIAGCGVCPWFDATRTEGRKLEEATVKLAQNLPKDIPLFYKAFTALLQEIGMGKIKDVSVDHEAKKKVDTMEDYDQLKTVDPTDMARDDFDMKAANKTLDVKYNIDEEEGTCHLFVLLDVSISMMTNDLGGRVCRAFAANVVTLSLLNFAFKERYKVHVVPFAGNVDYHNVQHAVDRDSALKTIRWLGGVNYTGGGTDVQEAVLYGYEELQKDPTYRKCDLVLISDGCAPLTDAIVSRKPAKTKLRTLVVGNDMHHYGTHSKALKEASDTYYNITWDNMANKLNLGGALSGIADPDSNDE